jgi:hypothetical protein
MTMPNSKNTRAAKRLGSKTTKRASAKVKTRLSSRGTNTDKPPTPGERLYAVVTTIDKQAYASNTVLTARADVLQAVKNVNEFLMAEYLSMKHDGGHFKTLMLIHSMQDIEKQLEPLLEAARAVAYYTVTR